MFQYLLDDHFQSRYGETSGFISYSIDLQIFSSMPVKPFKDKQVKCIRTLRESGKHVIL